MTSLDVEMYRRLLESSPEGVVLVDAQKPEHTVVYVNPGFEALTGYSAADLIGKNLRLLQADDRDQDARHRLREALDGLLARTSLTFREMQGQIVVLPASSGTDPRDGALSGADVPSPGVSTLPGVAGTMTHALEPATIMRGRNARA